MAVGSGIASQLGALAETTYGVAPSLSAMVFYEFKSETLALKKTTVQGQGLHASGLYNRASRRVLTNYAAAGGITMDLPTQGLNQLLYAMFGSYGQANAALTQQSVSTTVASGSNGGEISAIASWGGTYGGSGVLDVASTTGFPSAGTITVAASGSTTATVTYTGKTSTTFTGCAYVSGSATGTVATGGAVGGVTGAYESIHYPGDLGGHSLCWQKGVPATSGTVEPFTYTGGKITDWTISVETGALAQFELTLDFRNELAGSGNSDPLNGSVPSLQAFTEPATNSVFHFREATLLTGGTASTTSNVTSVSGASTASQVKSCQVKHMVPLDVERFFLGSSGFKSEQLQNGFRGISGQFVVEWQSSEAMYNAFAADTPTALQLQFAGTSAIGSSTAVPTLDILIPDIFLDGESPQVRGPEIVTQTVGFTGLDDGTDNQIQATYWTLDAS